MCNCRLKCVCHVTSGKEDLELGPNDLHLDDFLLSGKFDLIAYADPELNLEDKKDMFNEELDLGEPVEEREGGERRRGEAHLLDQVKQEVKDAVKTSAAPRTEAEGPPTLLIKVGPSLTNLSPLINNTWTDYQ